MTSYLPHRRGRSEWSALSDDALEALSLRLEEATGYDSIPTIEEHYDAGGGFLVCPFPKCSVRRRSSVAMWRHVHFGTTHGLSFDVKYPEDVKL